MLFLAEMLLLLISVGLIGFIGLEYVRGRSELLSARNVAILGFVVFQSLSGYLWLKNEYYLSAYLLADPGGAAMQFALASLVFVVVALVTYAKTPAAGLGARIAPTSRAVPNDATMVMFAVVLLGLAVFMRFAVLIPYVNILADILGISLCGVAAGIGGWLIGRHTFNPMYLVVAGLIVAAALAIPLSGAYGRRSIVSAALGVAWGLYYARFRYERPARTLTILAITALPMLVAFSLFSSVRGGGARRGSVTEIFSAMLSRGSISRGLQDLDGQGTAGVSMWLMQNIGAEGLRERDTLATFLYMFWYPIPRAMVPDKPMPITMQIPDLANITNVAAGLNIGPGIVGHAFADGGWWVLIFYAIFAGWLIRNIDEIVKRNPYAPFVVLPIGSTLGELLGAPRGESGYMMWQFIFGTTGAFGFIVLTGKFLEMIGYGRVEPADGADQYDDEGLEYDEDFAGYGEDNSYGEDDEPGTPGSSSSTSTPS